MCELNSFYFFIPPWR